MNRCRARVSSVVALVVALVAAALAPTAAQDAPASYWFAGTRLIFANPQTRAGETAVAVDDPGVQRLVARVGATLAFASGQSYITLTTADRRVVAFALGDDVVRTAAGTQRLPFAPYAEGQAYVPLLALARVLDIVPVAGDAGETVLQPQLAALDVRTDSGKSYVVVRGATKLRPNVVVDRAERVTIAFAGLGSSLAPARKLTVPGLQGVAIAVSGSARAPVTTVTFAVADGASHVVFPVAAQNELELGFAPRGLALDPLPPPRPIAQSLPTFAPVVVARAPIAHAPPTPPAPVSYVPRTPVETAAPTPVSTLDATPAASAAVVTNLVVTPTDAGASIGVTVNGSVPYDWHRLSDNRFYIDLHGATLGDAGRDEKPNLPTLESVRIRQIGTVAEPVVRVALTLLGDKRVDVQANDQGLTLIVGASDALEVARSGAGRIGGPDPYPTAIAPFPSATPNTPFAGAAESPAPWKFGVPTATPLALPPPGSNPRLIVIDAGHGGSDTGTAHNGLVEKTITLDIAQRLRALLVAQGWLVKMTRTTDVDVYGPNASDVNELQARVNVANYSAARLFISIHVNYYGDPSIRGTTTYYTKDMDLALARAVQRNAIAAAGTFDDGVRHGHLYVTNHTTMPAVLVETGFISNPGDAARLASPAWMQSIAQGIASGVKEYAGKPPRAAVSAAGDAQQ